MSGHDIAVYPPRVIKLRADSGFFDAAILSALAGKKIDYSIAARLTQPLQRAICQAAGWWALEPGLALTALRHCVIAPPAGRHHAGCSLCANRSDARQRRASVNDFHAAHEVYRPGIEDTVP